ncbi:ABC transporter permease [Aeromicrobium sp. YIM 150415]|uniref:ABC transporter permease n=1 Tax=Aeromicrobium sp. YIM 150415 TaxID=2803912 RepID=UPI0019659FB8|nr:ABC transporter permease [Aeromicrobium sp. YIM 150415]MBM9464539.1 ABC transporter permease [Aeromicrobium sp. YIM 150415]
MRWLQYSRAGKITVGLIASALFVFAIWLYTESKSETSYIWPSFGDVGSAFADTWLFENVGSDVVPSLRRMFTGFALAVIAGVAVGFMLGSSSVLDALANPVVNFLRSIPAAALLPPMIVLFGIGDLTKVAVIAFVCCWPIILNTRDGVRELDSTLLASASVYGISGVRRFVFIVLPAVSPRIFAGMRISLSIAILLLVTSEMVASTNGIGYFVFLAQQRFAVDAMWAGVILLGLLGVVLNFLLSAIERRALRWNRSEDPS